VAARKKPKIYIVEWLDASIGTDHDVINFTVGYLMSHNEKGIRIAHEWCGNPDVDEFDEKSFIPLGMIRKIKVVKSCKVLLPPAALPVKE